jgi:hypothetical protein
VSVMDSGVVRKVMARIVENGKWKMEAEKIE